MGLSQIARVTRAAPLREGVGEGEGGGARFIEMNASGGCMKKQLA